MTQYQPVTIAAWIPLILCSINSISITLFVFGVWKHVACSLLSMTQDAQQCQLCIREGSVIISMSPRDLAWHQLGINSCGLLLASPDLQNCSADDQFCTLYCKALLSLTRGYPEPSYSHPAWGTVLPWTMWLIHLCTRAVHNQESTGTIPTPCFRPPPVHCFRHLVVVIILGQNAQTLWDRVYQTGQPGGPEYTY